MNDQQRASQTVMSPEALMPRASAIGARPLPAIRWSSHTTIARRGRHERTLEGQPAWVHLFTGDAAVCGHQCSPGSCAGRGRERVPVRRRNGKDCPSEFNRSVRSSSITSRRTPSASFSTACEKRLYALVTRSLKNSAGSGATSRIAAADASRVANAWAATSAALNGGVHSAMAHLSCGCGIRGTLGADQIGPDQVPVVRAEVAAGDCACRSTLDGQAVGGIQSGSTSAPVAYRRLTNAQSGSELADSAELINGRFQW